MRIFTGTTAATGLTVGPVVRIDRGMVGLHRIVSDPYRERALYDAAIVLAKDELMQLQKHAQDQQDADILMFQVALLEDEATVKRLSRKNGHIWLLPENDDYQPIDGTNAQILGKVTAVVRQY